MVGKGKEIRRAMADSGFHNERGENNKGTSLRQEVGKSKEQGN